MLKSLALAAVIAGLVSCGGAEPPDIAQCNGTPRAAVVFVGNAPFPELAGIPDACVYSTRATTTSALDPVVDRALKAANRPRVYFIGAYSELPLRWRASRPGIAETTSLWFTPDGASPSGIVGTITPILLNDTLDSAKACNGLATKLIAQGNLAVCQLWDTGGFTPAQRAEAIRQLHLELAQ
jgi:hypothetical protein